MLYDYIMCDLNKGKATVKKKKKHGEMMTHKPQGGT